MESKRNSRKKRSFFLGPNALDASHHPQLARHQQTFKQAGHGVEHGFTELVMYISECLWRQYANKHTQMTDIIITEGTECLKL